MLIEHHSVPVIAPGLTMISQNNSILPYQLVKDYILNGIHLGKWTLTQRLPSENELVRICHVSRMTARKALAELTHEGVLKRIKGLGTYINSARMCSSLLEIIDIADEIKLRGNEHHCIQMKLIEKAVPERVFEQNLHQSSLQDRELHPTTAFYSEILHFENGAPVQLEKRYVNPAIARDYLLQDFNRITPASYLMQTAPVTHLTHEVKAVMPSVAIRKKLQLQTQVPCLKLLRNTWSGPNWATISEFYYPGDRYSLTA